MVKRPRGSAALVSPCWRPGIWPVFEDQSCNFLCFPLFSVAFGRLGQMNKTKAIFKIILCMLILLCLISLSSNEHMSSCPCSIPPALSELLLFSFCIAVLLYWYHPLPSFLPYLTSLLPSLLLTALLCISPSISPSAFLSSLLSPLQRSPIPSALHSFVWSPSSYPQHIRCPRNESRESGRAKGRAWCRAQGIGFNEASLNEFTAFHWAALSHVAD